MGIVHHKIEQPIQTNLPIHLSDTYSIDGKTLVENFDLPKTFKIEFEFILHGGNNGAILAGKKLIFSSSIFF